MRRAALLYNPQSGRSGNRLAIIERVAAALRAQSITLTVSATVGPGTAGRQAGELADANDLLFACGGDGTIHEVLQGLAFHSSAALGIVPAGSANVLARHLKLSLDPVQAALQQLDRKPASIPLGRVTYSRPQCECSRLFIALAGAGPDGMLVYRMLAAEKHHFGRLAYYAQAATLFLRSHSSFDLQAISADGEPISLTAISAMAVRIENLGGVFSPLAYGNSLHDAHFHLNVVKPPSRWSLPIWFATSWLGASRWNPYTRKIAVREFSCGTGTSALFRFKPTANGWAVHQ